MTRTKYRYVAAGEYDGELKTLSRAIRAGDLSVIDRAADILSPLVGDARCIVPMPSRNGLPNAVNALCEAVSSRTSLPVVNALGTKTERVSMCDAKGVIVCHNHPSGDIAPTKSDIKQTETIKKALDLFSLCLVDHIILGEKSYFSFADDTVRKF